MIARPGFLKLFTIPTLALAAGLCATFAGADHTPDPTSVAIVGSLQSELGCPGDWQPECSASRLVYDSADDVWQQVFTVPAGSWEYKAALNDSWDENYGAGGQPNGPNIALSLGAATDVKFYYDHKSHWITDNVNSRIATAVGNFQNELGCPGDWDPGCLRAWLQDADGDGVYSFSTDVIPAGSYEAKVTIDESWDENYGEGGVLGGANIPFEVPEGAVVHFSFDSATNIPDIVVEALPSSDGVAIVGNLQDELGCPGDWQPECPATELVFDSGDDVWQQVFAVPAGSWDYKAALNDSWDENYGAGAQPNGPNIALSLGAATDVKFYYDHKSHWITDNVNSVIATAVGSFRAVSRTNWVARATGTPVACAPGCRIPTATEPSFS